MARKIVFLSFLVISIFLNSCQDYQYGSPSNYPVNNYPQYPNSYPNNYPNNYPPAYYPPPQYPPQGYQYPNNNPPPYWNNRDNHHHNNDHRYPPRDNNTQINRPTPPPPPPPQATPAPQPSCPPGSVFTGSSCKITDSRLRRPGGDGNINPCPKGMWMSGNGCIKN